ncbi:MAG TPA: JAB domain-containing protein, partial [Tabrizicola sp.]|nr:JAB domain-containing protein [Tabrizicola sp.]
MVTSFHEPLLPLVAPPGDEDEAQPSALTGRLPSYISDHRQRLRDRFMQGGGAALPDYELLELVLFRAIPRQDVKPLARLLLDTFGDFNRVITASPARLQMVKGAGPAVVLELNASALILVHNHPSGDPTPSPEDVRVTEQIDQAGKLLDIEVLDHLIV